MAHAHNGQSVAKRESLLATAWSHVASMVVSVPRSGPSVTAASRVMAATALPAIASDRNRESSTASPTPTRTAKKREMVT